MDWFGYVIITFVYSQTHLHSKGHSGHPLAILEERSLCGKRNWKKWNYLISFSHIIDMSLPPSPSEILQTSSLINCGRTMRPRVYANYHAQWMISRPKSVTPLQGPQSDLTPSDHLKVHFIIHSSIECMKRHENWDSCQVRKCIFNLRISMYRINIHYTYYILTYDRNEYVNWWRRDSWANVTGLALLLTRRDCMEVASWSRSLSLSLNPPDGRNHIYHPPESPIYNPNPENNVA